MDEEETRQTQAWVKGWRHTADALDAIKAEELRELTDEQAGRAFAAMAADTELLWISAERSAAAGLIEQQRIFMLSDEHPARHRCRA